MVRFKVAVALHILFSWIYRGVINVHCSGYVWIEPAPVIQMGLNISINCHSTVNCQMAKLYMILNETHIEEKLLTTINKTTVQLQLRDFRKPYSTVLCYAKCPSKAANMIVCGTQFSAGYPPDSPTNLTCVIYEHSDHLTCAWDAGKYTYLSTNYILYLKSLQTEEEKAFPSNAAHNVSLSKLQGGKLYSIWVQAKNDLGTAHSEHLQVNLEDLVIPATPVVTNVETTDSSAPKTILHWKKQTSMENVYCEERHKALADQTWHMKEWDINVTRGPHPDYSLEANTEYEFQVRCRLILAKSYWSGWSAPFIYKTPEAAPSKILDVWRVMGPVYMNGSREVTVLIKPLAPKDARGRILGYTVFHESQGEMINLCNTSDTKCKVLVSPAMRTIHVTAYNSKGSSMPAGITVTQEHSNFNDFLSPINMQISHDDNRGISVKWELPKNIGRSVLWFIVEWISAAQHNQQHDFLWKKIPSQDTFTYIEGNITSGIHMNLSVYAVYHDGISKPCLGQLYLVDLVKRLPNTSIYTEPVIVATATGEISYDNDGEVFWGIGTGAIILSIVFLTLIFKKSLRKRVSTALASLAPKWLTEDFPNVENSSVVKSLQEKCDLMSSNSTHLFLNNCDPIVTEVLETSLQEECKTTDTKKGNRKMATEHMDISQNSLLVSTPDTEQNNGYKPQVSNRSRLGNVFSNTYETQAQALDPNTYLSSQDTHVFLKDYTSPITSLWNAEGTGSNTFLLEKINLILNNNRSGQSNTFCTTDEEPNTLLENQWKSPPSTENVQEQSLVPDELVSCLGVVTEESIGIKSYFPQTVGKLFQ
ncbi:interleukin-23 receptor isoform X1 [Dermochelys coriacea]|uniref:interleukin-23 receptor isoform X1 n=1 Tax=Dermochelys coriacea TaxID=27794 RepID=UPI001CA8643F|nr:interleukin-23 receptor isoform X1 [Dermochelys coriacea]